jgi:hypothetical protein
MPSRNERVELEMMILRYRSLARRVVREESVQRINQLIAELEMKLRDLGE